MEHSGESDTQNSDVRSRILDKVRHDKARRDSVLEEFEETEHPPICHGRTRLDLTEQVVSKSSPLFVGQSVEI